MTLKARTPGAYKSTRAGGAPVNVTKAAASAGVSSLAARDNHKHDVTTAAPSTGIGASNAEGSAISLARSNHDHILRESGGQNLTMGAVGDGQTLQRSGTNIIGVASSDIGYSLSFGGDPSGSVPQYFGVTAHPSSTVGSSALGARTETIAPKAGNLNRLAYNTQSGNGTTVLKVLINGSVVETVTLDGSGVGTAALTSAVAVGDLIAVEWDAGTDPNDTNVMIYIA